jgi:enoyl-CoA hydratase/carnithine racemase
MSWGIEQIDRVAVVTMRVDPEEEKDWAFFRDLADACDRIEHEFADRAVVLTGHAGVFAAGLDYERVLELFARRDVEEIRGWFARYSTILLRLFTLPRPTVAALCGDTLSTDFFVACACDFRIGVDADARIGTRSVLHGVPIQSVFLELMKYAIGPAAASTLALSGRVLEPPEALAAGLVHRLAPAHDLRARAIDWAGRLACSLPAYTATKHALQAETLERMDRISAPLDAALLATLCSDDNLAAQAGALEHLRQTPKAWRR